MGIDSLGQEHTIWKNDNLLTTWAKNDDRWDIDRQVSLLIPSLYDSLTSKYEGRGQEGFLYVCHITLDFVSVIDTKTNKVMGMIPCARGSDHIAFANENDVGFATSFDANSMRLFRKSTNERITDIPLGEQPSDVILDPGEDFVYVSHQSKDGLWVLSRRTHQVIKKLPAKTGPLYWSARERKLYQPQIFTPFVDVIDPAKDFAFDRIEVGGRPLGLAFTPDERYAYVTNFDLNEVEKIETSSKTIAKRISSIPNPRGICIDADGHFAFITNVVSNKLTILDLSRDKVVDSLGTGHMPTDVVIDPAAHSVYVSNQGAGTISVFDIATHKLTQTIPVADNPISLRLDSVGSSKKVSVK
jgi:YVTN family beta-propeller protein